MTIATLHKLFLQGDGVSTDTRQIKPNTIFFALKGDNFDGNVFAENALNLGASFSVIDNINFQVNEKCILVDDVLKTLQKLATFHRKHLNTKVVALTGSNGKTTTKELFQAVLSQKYNCKATVGNLNNHIGVPLTLLSFDKDTEIGIVEMGANHQKEIEKLCKIAQPDIGYITNYGKAHLEGFGGFHGVIKGKSEMYQFLRAHQKIVLIHTDDPLQIENAFDIIERIEFSIHDLNIKLNTSQERECLTFEVGNHLVETNLYGNYNLTNCMAAIALGLYFDVNIYEIVNGLISYIPTNHRSQWIEKGNLKIVLDTYNANPSSMEQAVINFIALEGNPKTLILGDMFELGNDTQVEHAKIVDIVKDYQNINSIFIGEHFYEQKVDSENCIFFKNTDEFSKFYNLNNFDSGYLLIKGSRGMKLEKLLNF